MTSNSPDYLGLPLILLSGMGADERVFRPQRAAFPNLVVPPWIPPRRGETLADYARRLAAEIDPGRPCFIGGASFGGFVALEMSRWLDPRCCFLIGSVRAPSEFPTSIRALRSFGRMCAAIPFEIFCAAAGWVAKMPNGLLRPGTRGFLRQLADADADFLRWATAAVLTWHPPAEVPCPICQIHGDRDVVLPLRHTRPDRIIRGAGHVLSLSKGPDVNRYLREKMAEYCPSPAADCSDLRDVAIPKRMVESIDGSGLDVVP